ncbi:hypothetical protein OIO90_001628 [Microbotryomycetes sp. JL221]|nr:hypothetical protein OIO90_001628 [Microbotryomycetes sp. JL221]
MPSWLTRFIAVPLLVVRPLATIASIQPGHHRAGRQHRRDDMANSDVISPRRNIFGEALQPLPSGDGPISGFFRNGFCDASPLDPGSHTVAAVLTKEFLEFSASQGNDLRVLFPTNGSGSPTSDVTKSPCRWCLCAGRWAQAVKASLTHPKGDAIVPRLFLDSTHENAIRDSALHKQDFERFAIGGNGDGSDPTRPGSISTSGNNVGR